LDLHGAAPDPLAVLTVQPLAQRPRFGDRFGAGEAAGGAAVVATAVPAASVLVETAAGELLESALVDAVDRDAELADVDRGDRQSGGGAARQDEALAGQRDSRGARAPRPRDLFLLGELDAA